MVRNILLSFSGQALTFVVALLALPTTVHAYGIANYGIIALVITTLGAATILDLGLSRSTTKFVAERLASHDEQGVINVIWSSTLMQMGLGLMLALVCIAVRSRILPHVDSKSLSLSDASIVIFMVAAALPLTLASGSLRGALEGAQRFGLVSLIKGVQNCSLYLVPAVCGWFQLSVMQVAAVLSGSRLVVAVAYFAICASVFPNFWRFSLVDAFKHLKFWHYTGWLAISNIVVTFLINADRMLLAAWAGVAAVGYYAIPMEVVNGLSVIAGCITGVLMPVFSNFNARRDKLNDIPVVFFRGVRWVFFLLLPISTILFVQSRFLIGLWQGVAIAVHAEAPLRIALVALLINALGWVPTSLALGLGRADIVVKFQIAQVPMLLLFGWLLIPSFGAAGAATVFLIRVIFETIGMYWATRTILLQQSFANGTRTLRLDRILILAALAIPFYLASQALTTTAGAWSTIVGYIAVYLVFWWTFAADHVERNTIIDFLLRRPI